MSKLSLYYNEDGTPMVWQSENNTSQMIIVLKGSIPRSELPQGYANSSNPLLSITQGGNTEFNFTAILPYDKAKFDTQTSKGKFITYEALFGDAELSATVYRTTHKTPWKNSPVANPKTGEIMQYEGLDLYQYAEVKLGGDNLAKFYGHRVPEYLMPKVDITASV